MAQFKPKSMSKSSPHTKTMIKTKSGINLCEYVGRTRLIQFTYV